MSNSLIKLMRRSSKTPSPDKTDIVMQSSSSTSDSDSGGVPVRDATDTPTPPPLIPKKSAARGPSPPKLASLNPFKTKPPVSKFAAQPGALTSQEVNHREGTPLEMIMLEPLSQAADSDPEAAAKPLVRKIEAQGCEFEVTETQQMRKAKRADSHHDSDMIVARDFAATDPLTVPALNIKKADSQQQDAIIQPLSVPKRSLAQELIAPPPQTAANERKRASAGLTNHSPNSTSLNAYITSSKAAKTLGISGASSSSPNSQSSSTAGPPVVTPQDPSNTRSKTTVTVRPPVFDFTKKDALQWTTAGVTSSRPHAPWEDSPRWKCCGCGGHTIVEQTVCSNLACDHDRCPAQCRVDIPRHPPNMFGGRFMG